MTMVKVAGGKTKDVFLDLAVPGTSILHNHDVVTWKDKHSAPLEGKGAWCTTTTCNMFKILAARGRQTAFIEQTAPNEFRATYCDMVKFEAVERFENRKEGSYHLQYPDAPLGLFEQPVVQLFLKTEKKLVGDKKLPFFDEQDLSAVGDDPLVVEVLPNGVWVQHAKHAVAPTELRVFVPYEPKGYEGDLTDLAKEVEDAVLIDGTIIHDALKLGGWDMADIKIEYGIPSEERRVPRTHRLIAADVIDADSMRVKDENGVERSKQPVRDKDSVEGAAEHYSIVALKSAEILEKVLAA